MRFRVASYLLLSAIVGCSRSISHQEDANQLLADASQEIQLCEHMTQSDRTSCQEQVKLRIELANSKIAWQKLHADRSVELWRAAIQGITISGPIIAALIAAWYARKNFLEEQRLARQSREEDQRLEREARVDEEKLQFQLKAAEIALNAQDSGQVRTKARILATLFPERLPRNFADDFNPNLLRFGPGGPQFRLDLLRLLMQYPERREDLVQFWGLMFPGDKGWKPEDHPNYFWLNELIEAITNSDKSPEHTEDGTKSGQTKLAEASPLAAQLEIKDVPFVGLRGQFDDRP